MSPGQTQLWAYRAQGITDVQGCKLASKGWEADVEVDSQQVPMHAPVHHHLRLCARGEESCPFLCTADCNFQA